MNDRRCGKDLYTRMLDGLGYEEIERLDREQSARQYGGSMENDNWQFTFSALSREEQADMLRAIAENLPTKTKHPNMRAGSSYAIKHMLEHYLGRYVSNLQCKVAFRILWYDRGGDDLNPHYNISKRELMAFNDLSRSMESLRFDARNGNKRAYHDLGRQCAELAEDCRKLARRADVLSHPIGQACRNAAESMHDAAELAEHAGRDRRGAEWQTRTQTHS